MSPEHQIRIVCKFNQKLKDEGVSSEQNRRRFVRQIMKPCKIEQKANHIASMPEEERKAYMSKVRAEAEVRGTAFKIEYNLLTGLVDEAIKKADSNKPTKPSLSII